MSDFKVVILTRDTLTAIGLRSILESAFGIGAVAVTSIPEYGDIEPHLFFVDAATLAARLGFFLPRKAKTVLLTQDHTPSEDFRTLCVTDSESDMVNAISAFLDGSHQEEKNDTGSLSQREKEVLKLIAAGKINKEIAQELNISINTVLTHRKNITAKLGIKSISGLTFYAMMNGIV